MIVVSALALQSVKKFTSFVILINPEGFITYAYFNSMIIYSFQLSSKLAQGCPLLSFAQIISFAFLMGFRINTWLLS